MEAEWHSAPEYSQQDTNVWQARGDFLSPLSLFAQRKWVAKAAKPRAKNKIKQLEIKMPGSPGIFM